MASDVLIDSNVYIDLLRARRDPVTLLYEWAERRDCSLVICGMVRVEVLRGIVSLKARQKVCDLMDVMVNAPSDSRMWEAAVNLAWQLDRRGGPIPGADAVIAASAMRIGAAVMTADAHFRRIDGLAVVAPPAEWGGKSL